MCRDAVLAARPRSADIQGGPYAIGLLQQYVTLLNTWCDLIEAEDGLQQLLAGDALCACLHSSAAVAKGAAAVCR